MRHSPTLLSSVVPWKSSHFYPQCFVLLVSSVSCWSSCQQNTVTWGWLNKDTCRPCFSRYSGCKAAWWFVSWNILTWLCHLSSQAQPQKRAIKKLTLKWSQHLNSFPRCFLNVTAVWVFGNSDELWTDLLVLYVSCMDNLSALSAVNQTVLLSLPYSAPSHRDAPHYTSNTP